MAFIVASVIMLYVAGINKKYIIVSFLLVIIAIPLLYFFVLPEHAKLRIDVYLNPYLDPRGAGYNIIQSKLAIGAGRLIGQGWMNGTQTHLGFLYPKTTDFIFSVIGEELGFVGATGILLLFCALIWRGVIIGMRARDRFGALIAFGMVLHLALQVALNVAVVTDTLPNTGIGLPFFSYGGSSMIICLVERGVVLSVSN